MSYLLINLAGLSALIALFYLTGWFVDRSAMEGRGCRPYPYLARFGLGAAVWMALVFALAAFGWLRPAGLVISIALVVVVVLWRAPRGGGDRHRAGSAASPAHPSQPESRVLALLLAALLLLIWLQVLWPGISWDANTYHLTVPRLYLESGGFRRIPFNVYSNWPLNAQMLFTLALGAGDHVLAKQLHFGFGLACLLLIWCSLSAVSRPWVGWFGAALFVLNPLVLDEMRAAYVDLVFAFFFLLAFLFVHDALESEGKDSPRRLVLAGVFAGIAAGCKPTAFTAVFCLAVLIIVGQWRRAKGGGRLLVDLGRFLLPAAAVFAPWLIKSWVSTGNPVYPFLFGLFGGPEWSAGLSLQLQEWQRGIGMGREWQDYLLLPWRVIVLGGPGYDRFDGEISRWWLLFLPLAGWMSRRQALIGRSLLVAGLYFVLWALSSQQMRFLIPVLPLLSIAGALGLFELGQRYGDRWRPLVRSVGSLAAAVALLLAIVDLGRPARTMLKQYLEVGGEVRQQVENPVYRFIDEQLPPEARLMFLNTNHGYFCHRDFIADSFFEASQINALLARSGDPEGIDRALRELGITHLLIENRDRGIPWPQSLFAYLNDAARVRPLYRSPDGVYDVVEVMAAAAPGGS